MNLRASAPPTHTQNTRVADSAVVRLNEDHLLEEFAPALKDWAYRYSGGDSQLRKDLYQEGAIGLVQAARRFDPCRGVKFSTLARRHVRGRMLNYLRRESDHRKCLSLTQACYVADDHDDDNPPQEDCLPITTAEALEQSDRFLFEVDVNLLRGVTGSARPC
jgi:RNA polymerase sigma factor (sigma-70 family)